MKSRRNLVKGLFGAGIVSSAMPSAWVKPLVKSVILPAHAQTSTLAPGTFVFPGRSVSLCSFSNTRIRFSIDDSDILAPQIDMSGSPLDLFISLYSGLAVPGAPEGGNSMSISITYPFATGYYGLGHYLTELEYMDVNCGGAGDYQVPFEQEQVRGGVRGTVNGTAYAVRGTITSQGRNIILSDLLFIPHSAF